MQPSIAQKPYQIADSTWVIPELYPAAPGTMISFSSAVITGKEPVVVDTGTEMNRERWLQALGSIVNPADVRWIFVSHDDPDHIGNLEPLLALAPKATVISTWFTGERLKGTMAIPLDRQRWINDGESFDVGDRRLVAVRPPLYESPTTRGLFDPKTGFYWAADAFSAFIHAEVQNADDVPAPLWEDTFTLTNRIASPWVSIVDPAKYSAEVAKLEALGITSIASAHGPSITGARVKKVFEMTRALAGMPEAPLMGQADLEHIREAMRHAG